MSSMQLIFSLKDLYIKNDYSISRQIEQIILDQLRLLYNVEEKDVDISQGCNSAYDFRMLNKLFELKIMSTSYYNIEISRASGQPSGLSSSKADYYIIVNPGSLYQKEVMKIRIVATGDLRQAVQQSTKVRIYEPNANNSLGSVCHQLDPKTLLHDFVGTFPITDKIDGDYYIDFAGINFFPLGRFCSLNIQHQLRQL